MRVDAGGYRISWNDEIDLASEELRINGIGKEILKKGVDNVLITYEKEAAKHISKFDKPTKRRIKEAIEKLPSGDVKKLKGYNDDYRLRVGDLRILYSVKDDIITIKDVLPRGQAYKRI